MLRRPHRSIANVAPRSIPPQLRSYVQMPDPAQAPPLPAEALPGHAARWERTRAQAARVAPWLSLALGLGSALWMNRHPSRAAIFIGLAVAAWLMVALHQTLVARAARDAFATQPDDVARSKPRFHGALAWLTLAGGQSAIQSALWFALPLYFAALAPTLAQLAFMAVLLLAAAATLLDPLFVAIASRRTTAAMHLGIAGFGALAAVLPLLGIGSVRSLALAAGLSATAALWFNFNDGGWRQPWRYTMAQLIAVPLLLLAGPWSVAVPAAPLHLGQIAFASAVVDRLPSGQIDPKHLPDRLICYTPIVGPPGVRETIVHVWEADGVEVARHRLDVRAGRIAGFRTWSRHAGRAFARANSIGCRVFTDAGQELGSLVLHR